jgi:hypothetical protein
MAHARSLTTAAAAAAAAVLALGSPARAQAPRAGAPTPGEAPGSRLAVDLGTTGNLSRGLVYRDLITNRGVVQLWDGPWGVYLQPYWLYSRIGTAMGRVTADNDIYVRLGMFRNLSRSVFVTAVNVYDHSLRRRIAHRDLFGGGAGLNLVQRPEVLIATSAAVLGEVTDFDGERLVIGDEVDAITGNRTVVRGAVRLHGRYKLGGGKLSFVHDTIVMPSFQDPANDYRINFSATLDAPIAKGFSARAQAEGTRDGVIVEGTKRDALVITFGVSYRGEWQRKKPEPEPPAAAPTPAPATPTPATPAPAPAPAPAAPADAPAPATPTPAPAPAPAAPPADPRE